MQWAIWRMGVGLFLDPLHEKQMSIGLCGHIPNKAMVSLTPSTSTNTPTAYAPITTSTLSSCPFFSKTWQVSLVPKQSHGFKVSCKTIDRDHQNPTAKSDRRTVLIGLGGLYGAASLGLKTLPKEHSKLKMAGVAQAAEALAAAVFPITLDKIVKVTVPRPKKSRSQKEKEDEDEILVIEGIELDKEKFVKFDVYVNDEGDAPSGPGNSEFAGSFTNLPHTNRKQGTKMKTCLRLGITGLLEDLGAEDDESVLVSLVPVSKFTVVTIGGVKIEFDS